MWEFLTFLPDEDKSRATPEPRKALPGNRESAERHAERVVPPAFLTSDARPTSDDEACKGPAPPEAETLDYLRFLDAAVDPASDRDYPPDVEADSSGVGDD
jgi:hypothetical protein